jgi:hypothetical protein
VRFRQAFGQNNNPKEISTILGMIQEEIAALNKAIRSGGTDAYKQFGIDRELAFNKLTNGRYLDLAATNFDHFGDGAVAAYKAGHVRALKWAELAGKGLPDPGIVPSWNPPLLKLEDAYMRNAFADHYLSDLFSAGHLCTDRVKLHVWSIVGIPFSFLKCGDYLAMYVHDEDSHYGLNVENERGDRWRCYGDKRYFNPENQRNRELCEEAVKVSIQEIYNAYQTKNGADVFGALKLIPNLAKARDWKTNPNNRLLFYFE